MTFNDAVEIVKKVVPETVEKEYDGLIIKKLEASNTLGNRNNTKQTHIAITGKQMDIFPYISLDGYFNVEYSEKDDALKKYLLTQIPISVYRSNLSGLIDDKALETQFHESESVKVHVSVVRSRRDGATDQIQLSLISYDDDCFVWVRKHIQAGAYLIIAKCKEQISYDAFFVDSDNKYAGDIAELNNHFYKLNDITKVPLDEIVLIEDNPSDTDYSINDLGYVLKAMYDSAPENMKVCSIHSFGIKYGEHIRNNDYKAPEIIRAAGISESYSTELNKGLQLYNCILNNEFGIRLENAGNKKSIENLFVGANILYYGVPGCGKSFSITQTYPDSNNSVYSDRVVFHPDYTYSDFVGQILPKNYGGSVEYIFTPGPFTRILNKAIHDPSHMYYLVIEEINRGNAPAIFGDIFQLLDRNEKGASEYSISNSDIAEIVYGDCYERVCIPANLTIIATMNTADQSVFTLDTAFKRRWKMKHIKNTFEHNDNYDRNNQLDTKLCETDMTWKEFATTINNCIAEKSMGINNSDKSLGVFFARGEELTDSKLFAEKVIMYLYNDVFTMNPEDLFDPKYKTLAEVLDAFETEKFGVFNSNLGLVNVNGD